MIEKLKTTVTVEARKETTSAIYQLNYSVVNNTLTAVNCSVNKKTTETVDTPEGTQTINKEIYAGNLYLTNGNITCSIPQENDAAVYVAEFVAIVGEIEAIVSSELSE